MTRIFEPASTCVKRVCYDDTRLSVTYFNRKGIETTYEYENVPESIYISLIEAKSANTFLNEKVKNIFKCKKV